MLEEFLDEEKLDNDVLLELSEFSLGSARWASETENLSV